VVEVRNNDLLVRDIPLAVSPAARILLRPSHCARASDAAPGRESPDAEWGFIFAAPYDARVHLFDVLVERSLHAGPLFYLSKKLDTARRVNDSTAERANKQSTPGAAALAGGKRFALPGRLIGFVE
jgi:hypothetical protein